MGVLLVALFEDEPGGAHRGLEVLAALHAEGTLSVYAAARLAGAARRERPRRTAPGGGGTIRSRRAALGDMGASPALAVSLAALQSLTGGPVALAMSSVPAALIGTVRELDEAGVDAALLEQAARHQGSGGGAVLAEVVEEHPMALDAPMLARGGRVSRRGLDRAATAEERLLREIGALRAELGEVGSGTRAPAQPGVYAEAWRLRESALRGAVERAASMAEALRREAGAKVAVLREQASRVPEPRRAAIAERAAVERTALEARVSRLYRAAELGGVPPARTVAQATCRALGGGSTW